MRRDTDGGEPIEERANFRHLRYTNCWEDAAVVCAALEPLRGARCLSIASAGDNTLSLLARGAAEVLAVDLSPAQLALFELKRAGFAALDHDELLAFLGARDQSQAERASVFAAALRPRLGPAARAYWDAQPRAIRTGVLHAGRLEAYFRLFRNGVLPLAHSRATVAALLAPRDAALRERFHREVWDTWTWRTLCRLFFARGPLGRLGRDPEFFRHVDGAVGGPLLERARHALAVLPTHDNPYLSYILTGRFGAALPDYLRPEWHEAIRASLGRVSVCRASLEAVLATVPAHRFDAFNLSDVPEYMDLGAYHALLEAVARSAAPGARVAYWNLLAPRRRPAALGHCLDERLERAQALHARAQAPFYRALVLEVAR